MECFRFRPRSGVRRRPLMIISSPAPLRYKCLQDKYEGSQEETIRHVSNEHIRQVGDVVHHCVLCGTFSKTPARCAHVGCPRIALFEYLPTESDLAYADMPGPLVAVIYPASRKRPLEGEPGQRSTFGGTLVPLSARRSLAATFPTAGSSHTQPRLISEAWDEELARFGEPARPTGTEDDDRSELDGLEEESVLAACREGTQDTEAQEQDHESEEEMTPVQKELLGSLERAMTAADLNRAYARLADHLADCKGARLARAAGPRRKHKEGTRTRMGEPRASLPAIVLQDIFSNDQARAMAIILEDSREQHRFTAAQLEVHMGALFAAKPPIDTTFVDSIRRGARPFEMESITTEQIRRAMLGKSSAPGYDGLTHKDIRTHDSRFRLTGALFNACLRLGEVPAGFKRSRLALLLKREPKELFDSWRPICVPPVLARLFSSILQERLCNYTIEEGLVANEQKGYVYRGEGTFEHAMLLEALLNDRKNSSTSVALMDIRSAFSSVRHELLLRLVGHLFPGALNIIRSMYSGAVVFAEGKDRQTQDIAVLAGILMGCPTSVLLFDIVMETIIARCRHRTDLGASVAGRHVVTLCYVDDLCACSANLRLLESLLMLICELALEIGFEFATLKTEIFSRATETTINFNGEALPVQRKGALFRYLGIQLSVQGAPDWSAFTRNFGRSCELLATSGLRATQALAALKRHIIPQLTYPFRATFLTTKEREGFQTTLARALKSMFELPQGTAAVFLEGSTRSGALGLPNMDILYVKTKCNQLLRMLYSADETIATLALLKLIQSFEPESITSDGPQHGLTSALAFMSRPWGSVPHVARERNCSITHAARTIARISRTLRDVVQLEWYVEGAVIMLRTTQDARVTTFGPHNVDKLGRALTRAMEKRLDEALEEGGIGFSYFVNAGHPCIFESYFLSDRTAKFLAKARANRLHTQRRAALMPRGPGEPPRSDLCGACRAFPETQLHALAGCRSTPVARRIAARHDAILHDIIQFWRIHRPDHLEMTTTQPEGCTTTLRPDMIIRNKEDGSFIIVDLAVAYETPGYLERRRNEKIAKYTPLAIGMTQECPSRYTTFQVEALVFGALGGNLRSNISTLKMMGFSPSQAFQICTASIKTAIYQSQRIWNARQAHAPVAGGLSIDRLLQNIRAIE